MPPEQPFEVTIRATDAANNTHTVDIEARLPANDPKEAVAKIVEASMDKWGSGTFKNVETDR